MLNLEILFEAYFSFKFEAKTISNELKYSGRLASIRSTFFYKIINKIELKYIN